MVHGDVPQAQAVAGSNSDTWETANSPALINLKKPMQQASHNMTKSLSLIAAVALWSLSVRRIAGVIGMRGNRGL